ncbi:MAG: sigma-70 family RNA polymerase sigma factor [Planctomycetales bacterium]|nr:sigma-70 family RNA polymerase sigma factor [Planctomycetales bacterium]
MAQNEKEEESGKVSELLVALQEFDPTDTAQRFDHSGSIQELYNALRPRVRAIAKRLIDKYNAATQPTRLFDHAFAKALLKIPKPDKPVGSKDQVSQSEAPTPKLSGQQDKLTIRRFEDSRHFVRFLARVMTSVIVDEYRARNKFQVGGNESIESVEDGRTQHTPLERVEEKRELWNAIEHLSEVDREIVTMRWFTNLTFSEIASQVGLSVAACFKRHAKALNTLREHIEKQDRSAEE